MSTPRAFSIARTHSHKPVRLTLVTRERNDLKIVAPVFKAKLVAARADGQPVIFADFRQVMN